MARIARSWRGVFERCAEEVEKGHGLGNLVHGVGMMVPMTVLMFVMAMG